MAKRRMFTMTVIDSDAFLDMPLSTQALYFHLNMRADDDGFINNYKKIMRMIGSTEDELKVLIAKRFLIGFDTGVIVIKHWRMHNLLRKDRYQSTVYSEEMESLEVKENGSYTEWQPNGNQITTSGCPSIGKVSIGKDSLGEVSQEEIIEIVEYKTQSDFSLPKDTVWSKTSEEYKKAVVEFIDKYVDELRMKAMNNGSYDWIPKVDSEDFILAMESKDYKYKNFIATYKTWLRRK